MSLINCKNNRDTCGPPVSSTCVSYQGAFTGVLNQNDFPCNVNVDDVIEKLSALIKSLQDTVAILSTQNGTANTNIHNIQNDILDIQISLSSLESHDINVEIDLGCLTTDASPCEISTKKYSLFSILQLFKNEICLLKS